MIIEASNVKQEFPDASFTKTLDILDKIGTYSYYIEANNSKIFVNSTNGKIAESSDLLNVVELPYINSISGRVLGEYYYLQISLDETQTNNIDIVIEGSYSK